MRFIFQHLIIAIVVFGNLICGSCSDNKRIALKTDFNQNSDKMKITIGTTVYTATLYDNSSAAALKKMLPLTVEMKELNGNEKFYYFKNRMPSNPAKVGTIKAGDLMLYGDDCLVLFYEDLTTSYSYTKLCRIDSIENLKDAVGPDSVKIMLE